MKRFTIAILLILAGFPVAFTAHAQSAIPLCAFDVSGTNGEYPEANLVLGPDGSLYGTTESGGASGHGAIFKVTTGGTLSLLASFNSFNGANPLDPLLLGPDGNFYGTTEYGGNTVGISSISAGLGAGTVFQMTTNGGLTVLVNFAGTNGANPHGGLALGPDGNLYGTTAGGGAGSDGTIFQMTLGGTLTTVTNFTGDNGSTPYAGLTLGPDGKFYGTTQAGGANSSGTIFQVTTNGTFQTLYVFGVTNGISPENTMTVGPDGKLYGSTQNSYYELFSPFPGFTFNLPSGNGTIFQITTNGTFTLVADLDNFNAGTTPNGSLLVGPDNNFYGVTYFGGADGVGTLFRVMTNGLVTDVVDFNNTNGAYPYSGLSIGSDGNLYGTTSSGGPGQTGNVYLFSPCSIALAASGGTFTVEAGSYPNSTNRVWATTDLSQPSAWQVLGSIIMDTNGMGQFPDNNTAGIPAKFYRLSYP